MIGALLFAGRSVWCAQADAASQSPTSAAPAGSSGCRLSRFNVVELGLAPAAINATGLVVGTNGAHRAAVWTAQNGQHELPLPNGFDYSEAVAVNEAGQIVLNAYDRTMQHHRAFVVAHGTVRALPGEQSLAFKIDANGDVAGESLAPGRPSTEPVLWHHGVRRALGGCCGGSAKVSGHGQVVGDAYDQDGRYHAFLWTAAGGLRETAPPGSRFSVAVAMNADQIVVQAPFDVFLLTGDRFERLTLAPKFRSQARAINRCGAIVGSYGPNYDAERAFLWSRESGFIDLNTRIEPESGWRLEAAVDINDRGQIVGRGDHLAADRQGFVLTPGATGSD